MNKVLSILLVLGASLSCPAFGGDTAGSPTLDSRAAQRSFFVPGWGQWYKGHEARGGCIAALEGAALAGAYLSYGSAMDARDDYRAGNGSYSDYRRRVDTTNYFLLAAGLIWAYNVADAYTSRPGPGVALSMGAGKYAALTYRIPFQ